jgi:hypothetical protein
MYHWPREHDVIEMIATEKRTGIRTVFGRIVPFRKGRHRLEDIKDDSIELRRHLTAEVAYARFEQHKERAMTENHRAGFIR